MKYLLPLFLIFSFSAKADIVRCFSPKKQFYQIASNLSRLKEEVPAGNIIAVSEILKKLKELGTSEDGINNLFETVILNPEFDTAEFNFTYRDKRVFYNQEYPSELRENSTSYKKFQLAVVEYMLENSMPVTISKILEILGFLSKKEVIPIIITALESRPWLFNENVVNDFARGQQIAHVILERKTTSDKQALGLFLLEKEILDNPTASKEEIISENLKGLGFSEKEVTKLADNSSKSKNGFSGEGMGKLDNGQELAFAVLKKPVTPKQARALASLEKGAYIPSITKTLSVLKKFEKKGFSEDDINNVFIPVMADYKFDIWSSKKGYISNGQELALGILEREVTDYQAIQLEFLNHTLVTNNIISTEVSEISEALVDTGSFSKKEIITFIIGVSSSYQYDFGKNLIDDLARGQRIAHEIFGKPVTDDKALALLLLKKEKEVITSPHSNLKELGFSEEESEIIVSELWVTNTKTIKDNIADSIRTKLMSKKLVRGQEIAFAVLKKPVTPKQARALASLEKEISSINFSPVKILEALALLKEQGFSEKEINDIFIPTILNSHFNKRGKALEEDYVFKGEELAREALGRSVTIYTALQIGLLDKELLLSYDINTTEVSAILRDIGEFSQAEIMTLIIDRSHALIHRFGADVKSELAQGQRIAHEILERKTTSEEQALALFLLEKELLDNPDPIEKIIPEYLEGLGFSEKEVTKLEDNSLKSKAGSFTL